MVSLIDSQRERERERESQKDSDTRREREKRGGVVMKTDKEIFFFFLT
jgi:hypothetical protein